MSLFLMVSKQDYGGCLGKLSNYDYLRGGGGINKRSSIFLDVSIFYITPVSTYPFGLIVNN